MGPGGVSDFMLAPLYGSSFRRRRVDRCGLPGAGAEARYGARWRIRNRTRPRHSHRRLEAVAPDQQTSDSELIAFRFGDDEYLGSRHDQGAIARPESNDRHAVGNDHRFFAVLVTQFQGSSVGRTRQVGHRGVGHRTLRLQIPGLMAFAGAARPFGEYDDFKRLDFTVVARQGARADN